MSHDDDDEGCGWTPAAAYRRLFPVGSTLDWAAAGNPYGLPDSEPEPQPEVAAPQQAGTDSDGEPDE